MLPLYVTIWLAVLLFALGETARLGPAPPARWAWWAFTTGLALAIVHTLLAFALVHRWSHAEAVRTTAMQTAGVYGVPFGGGIYVNYVFLAVWLADACWWRFKPPHQRPSWTVWTLRAFYLVILANAAVVFAAGMRRALGALLVTVLVWQWARAPLRAAPASGRAR